MKKSSAILTVLYFSVSLLASYILVPIGFDMSWEGTNKMTFSVLLVMVPIIALAVSTVGLGQICLAVGKPMQASALEPEVVYIVETVTVRRGAGNYVASLAVLRRAVLQTAEVDSLTTNRLLVFFPDKELREGGQVMGVTTKWFDAFSKTGATSETTLVLVGS